MFSLYVILIEIGLYTKLMIKQAIIVRPSSQTSLCASLNNAGDIKHELYDTCC
jgi:hypothetical protein